MDPQLQAQRLFGEYQKSHLREKHPKIAAGLQPHLYNLTCKKDRKRVSTLCKQIWRLFSKDVNNNLADADRLLTLHFLTAEGIWPLATKTIPVLQEPYDPMKYPDRTPALQALLGQLEAWLPKFKPRKPTAPRPRHSIHPSTVAGACPCPTSPFQSTSAAAEHAYNLFATSVTQSSDSFETAIDAIYAQQQSADALFEKVTPQTNLGQLSCSPNGATPRH